MRRTQIFIAAILLVPVAIRVVRTPSVSREWHPQQRTLPEASVRGDLVEKGVRIELRDPLSTYPEMRTPDDIHCPLNVGFVYGRSPEWIAKRYPETRALMIGSGQWNRMWDLVEWIDEDEVLAELDASRS